WPGYYPGDGEGGPGIPGATWAMELVEILGNARYYMCPRLPGMKLPRLRAPPPAGPALAPVVVAATLAVCAVVLNVAAVATPFPSSVSVTGLVRPKFWPVRLPNEPLSPAARKLARLLPRTRP